MPIWLRKYVYHEIQEFYENERKQYEKSSNGSTSSTLVDSDGKINRTQFKAAEPKGMPGRSVPSYK